MRWGAGVTSRVPLIELDGELGELLSPERRQLALRHLLVERHTLARGPFAVPDRDASCGLVLLDGLVMRETLVSDSVSAELLGPGDVLRPSFRDPARLLQGQTRHHALDAASVCPLTARHLTAFPEVTAVVARRLMDQEHRVAVEKAIAQLNGVDRRLLALFWNLAERWGHVTPDGIAVPLVLPHRVIAQLVGARRPTVTTMLHRLAGEGRLQRRADGSWLLTGEPVGEPRGETARIVRTRRRTGTPTAVGAGRGGPSDTLLPAA
jgi:hypothetical protein